MRHQIATVAVVFLMTFTGRSGWGQVQYTVNNLGTFPGGNYSAASGVNNSGQELDKRGIRHLSCRAVSRAAVVTTTPSCTVTGRWLISVRFLGDTGSTAYGINDSGQIVGMSTNGTDHTFLYSNGTMTGLGTLGGSWSQANSINDSGQVVVKFHHQQRKRVRLSFTATGR